MHHNDDGVYELKRICAVLLLSWLCLVACGDGNEPAGVAASPSGSAAASPANPVVTTSPTLALTPRTPTVAASPFTGTRIICEASTPTAEATIVSQATLDAIVTVLRKRAAGLGFVDARIAQNGAAQIVIDLPDTELSAEQLHALTAVGLFEIIDSAGEFLAVGTPVNTTAGTLDSPPAPGQARPAPNAPTYMSIVTSAQLVKAYPATDNFEQLDVEFELTPAGGALLLAYTRVHIGQPMSVVVDKVVVMTATIQAEISERGLIAGLSAAQVALLAAQLDSGALPSALTIVSTEEVP
jgi:preprotein translocase subunit SecD